MKKKPKIIISYRKMTDIEKGIKLRSGKVLFSPNEPKLSWANISKSLDEFLYSQKYSRPAYGGSESVEESIEKKVKVSSKIDVPNGFGDEAGEYLEKLNRSLQDGEIGHNQLHELTKEFEKYMSWFPDDVPQKKVKKFCKEAYDHTLWKSFVDGEIDRRQFVDLMY